MRTPGATTSLIVVTARLFHRRPPGPASEPFAAPARLGQPARL